MTKQYVRGIFLTKSNDLLVQVRNTVGKPNGWMRQFQLPGGAVDAGETPAQALVRETAEELGVTLQEEHLQYYQTHRCEETGAMITFFKVTPQAIGLWETFACAEPEKFDVVAALPLQDIEQYVLDEGVKMYDTYKAVVNSLLKP